jgi:hypothetical protein
LAITHENIDASTGAVILHKQSIPVDIHGNLDDNHDSQGEKVWEDTIINCGIVSTKSYGSSKLLRIASNSSLNGAMDAVQKVSDIHS